eukprot:gene14856-19967_t
MLSSHFPMPNNASMKYMVENNVIQELEWGCLTNTDAPKHSVNGWYSVGNNISNYPDGYLSGTTFWVNEHMAVGHSMYDIVLLQAAKITKIDRLVLQRAPCATVHLCEGVGTFDSFYKGLYISIMDAYQPHIPIFVRWSWQEKNMKPIYIGSEAPDDYVYPNTTHPNIVLGKKMCFERLLRRNVRCHGCFYPSLSFEVIHKFKHVAYKLASTKTEILTHHFVKNAPIVISFVHRGLSASRHMNNVPTMTALLQKEFIEKQHNNKFILHVIDSTNATRGYAEQIRIVARSNIVISEHGAFQANMIYMRNGSLLVDMRGPYPHGEFHNFANLARMFGVFCAPVTTKGLISHAHDEFEISTSEVEEIIGFIH